MNQTGYDLLQSVDSETDRRTTPCLVDSCLLISINFRVRIDRSWSAYLEGNQFLITYFDVESAQSSP